MLHGFLQSFLLLLLGRMAFAPRLQTQRTHSGKLMFDIVRIRGLAITESTVFGIVNPVKILDRSFQSRLQSIKNCSCIVGCLKGLKLPSAYRSITSRIFVLTEVDENSS